VKSWSASDIASISSEIISEYLRVVKSGNESLLYILNIVIDALSKWTLLTVGAAHCK